jgi:hypothetical protein
LRKIATSPLEPIELSSYEFTKSFNTVTELGFGIGRAHQWFGILSTRGSSAPARYVLVTAFQSDEKNASKLITRSGAAAPWLPTSQPCASDEKDLVRRDSLKTCVHRAITKTHQASWLVGWLSSTLVKVLRSRPLETWATSTFLTSPLGS